MIKKVNYRIKKVSSKQSKKNKEVAKIKASLPPYCEICYGKGCDPAHLLPRSLYPEYYILPMNFANLCREHHDLYDNNIEFRKKQTHLIERVKKFDEQAAIKYFQL